MKSESVKKERRKKIGLALGGGASKGLAHIGVIRALTEFGIPIDYVAGTSMGALIGGWYALDGEIDSVKDVLSSMRRAEKTGWLSKVTKKGDIKSKSSLRIIDDHFTNRNFGECKIPFKAIAANMKDGSEVVLEEGDLAGAIKASAAIPLVFDPVKIGDQLLIDGGVVNPVPADIVRAMGADIVIAVDVSSHWFNQSDFSAHNLSWLNIYSIFDMMTSIMSHQIAHDIVEHNADIIIRPPVLGYSWFDISQAENIISAGYRETRKSIADISKLAKIDLPERPALDKFWDFIFGIDRA